MILVDSSVWIDYFNGQTTVATDRLDDLLSGELLLTGDIILAEVLQGFGRQSHFRRARLLFDKLEYRDMLGHDVAIAAATNYRRLRARGVTVRKTIDVMIATFCIRNGHRLLHSDRDFTPMERHLKLKTVNSE